MGQTRPVQVVEDVGLVLARVLGGVQLRSVRTLKDPRVVAGGQGVEAQAEHPVEHQVEAHEGVAAQAGVGSLAGQVGAVERLDHSLAELGLQVPAVVGHPQ